MTTEADDIYNDALEDLRISGNVLMHECYAAPWAIEIPPEPALRQALGVGDHVRVIPFHLVRSGAFDLSYDGNAPERIATREVAICVSGAMHRMSFGKAKKATPLGDVLNGRFPRGVKGEGTEMLCGVFLLRRTPLNPLLSALPPLLKIRTEGNGASASLRYAADMLTMDVGERSRNSFTASRLLEVFCAQAIEEYRRGAGAGQTGWFKALSDPMIGGALAQFHHAPGAPWSVATLAETAAISPSRFAARFRETMGQSVMSYVSAWRMNLACRLLREGEPSLARIASRIGYEDVAAFSRAFKASVGVSPAHWRALNRLRQ